MTDATKHPDARLLEIWAAALAKRTGRSADEIKQAGQLEQGDFHHKVSIHYADGSSIIFCNALALVGVARGEVAIFTLKCGYMRVPLALGMDVIESDVVHGERVIRRRYVHKAEKQTAS
ncbi:MAG: hypothetical protein ACK4NA_16305 [Alphaproteobacteria bacterium]